jgi:hypothetical protein
MLRIRKGITIMINEVKIMRSATSDLGHSRFSARFTYSGLKITYNTIAPSILLNKPLSAYSKKHPSTIILARIILLRCL